MCLSGVIGRNRRLTLCALMDGLGLDALVLRDRARVTRLAGRQGVLVIRAAQATLIEAGADCHARLDAALAGARRVGSDTELGQRIDRLLGSPK